MIGGFAGFNRSWTAHSAWQIRLKKGVASLPRDHQGPAVRRLELSSALARSGFNFENKGRTSTPLFPGQPAEPQAMNRLSTSVAQARSAGNQNSLHAADIGGHNTLHALFEETRVTVKFCFRSSLTRAYKLRKGPCQNFLCTDPPG